MEKYQKDQGTQQVHTSKKAGSQQHSGNQNKSGNKNEHGVISVIQSPDEEKSNKPKQSDKESQSGDQKKHGVISIVQSPDEDKNKSSNQKPSDKKDDRDNQNQSGNLDKSGVPANRKSPEEEQYKKEPMPKSPTWEREKQQDTQQHSPEHKDMNKPNTQAKFGYVSASEEDMIDDTQEGNLYEDGTSQGMEDGTMNKKIRKGGR